jgi:glycerol-3-phosphate dehydrogenase
MADFDLAILGGGLNGASVARDAAGRGLRVLLLEQGDLGGGASSASPRLIHGDHSVLERRLSAGCERRWPNATFGAPHRSGALCDSAHADEQPAWVLRAALAVRPARRAAAAAFGLETSPHPWRALKRPVGTAFGIPTALSTIAVW